MPLGRILFSLISLTFSLTIDDQGALPGLGTEFDLCHILNINRNALVFFEDNILDIFNRLNDTNASNDVLFREVLKDIASGIAVIGGDRLRNFLLTQIIF